MGVHVGIGCIMMYNCGPHFSTAVLLAQDLSSVFLNPYLLLRHRYPNHPAIVVVRIVLCTWGTYYYINHYQEHLVDVDARLFPEWQAHLLAAVPQARACTDILAVNHTRTTRARAQPARASTAAFKGSAGGRWRRRGWRC